MSLGFKVPKSVAKFITLMQIAQMIVGVNTTLTVYYIKTHLGWLCQQTYANIYLSFVIYGSYMILFINYFVQTYVIKDKKKKRVVSTKKD
uniref:Elongation of very long chain fatty acids protein n=1 Tax=Panagrolaimus sp. JU765 TaxID=591449 RepID=A0AC34Q5K1_9BILA